MQVDRRTSCWVKVLVTLHCRNSVLSHPSGKLAVGLLVHDRDQDGWSVGWAMVGRGELGVVQFYIAPAGC
jgi:hypothetical protein